MIFKPEIARRFADCGITFLDEPTDVIPMAMRYLGHDPDSIDPAHLAEVEAMLKSVRPYIRYFSSAKMLIDLPNEEVCIAMSWSGDYAQAMYRAKEAGRPVELAYTTPREGTLAWFDLWFIPADAPHPGNAHLFLNYLLRPEVIAAISNETRYAAANAKAIPLVLPEVRNDPAVYPPDELRLTLREGASAQPERGTPEIPPVVSREDPVVSAACGDAHGTDPRPVEAIRRRRRGRWSVSRHRSRRAVRHTRQLRLRQDDAVADAGGVRAAERRAASSSTVSTSPTLRLTSGRSI